MRRYTDLQSALFFKPGRCPEQVCLPHTWNAFDGQDGGGDYWRGTGTYRINLPPPTPGKRQYVEFQGANHIATVYCNGRKLGIHKGGFSTFRFDLTDAMQPADNMLTVEVYNGICDVYPQRADFTFYGGLYRAVRFVEVEQAHFDLMKAGSDAVFVTTENTGSTRLDVFAVNCDGCMIRVDICDAEGNIVAGTTARARLHTVLQLDVAKPHQWNGVADPYCYSAQVTLLGNDQPIDQVCVSFGFRSFKTDANTGFWLNGIQTPLHGVCRHQDRKDMGWAISKAEHDEDARIIYEVGANTIRLAHYQHDQYFYNLCDKYGFVVWAEIPYISQHLEGREAYENTLSQMTELIAQSYNHPSICFWGIANEISIGGFSEAQLQNLYDLHALCKRLDPNRLTTMAQLSGVPADSEYTKITDVQSYNYYLGWYTGTIEMNGQRMDAWHAANPDKAFGISEYGADNYPCWHSATPFNHDYSEEYAVLYHREMLKTFAARPFLWATHMWNMFDFAADARNEGGFKGINAKGLVTYDRKLYKDSFYVYKAYWNPEPMVHICGRRFTDRAPDERNVMVLTNEAEVTLELNGCVICTARPVDHMVTFECVDLQPGENTLTARTASTSDTIVLNGVSEHNTAYDLPDIQAALQAGNWFQEQSDDGKQENYYTIETPGGELFANADCVKIVNGWLMSNEKMSMAEKMTIVSRLPNYQAMWGEKRVYEIKAVERHMTQQDLDLLDRMLRRIKKPQE